MARGPAGEEGEGRKEEGSLGGSPVPQGRSDHWLADLLLWWPSLCCAMLC